MRVLLKDTWFAPGARRFRKGEQEIPDELCAVFPEGHSKAGEFKYLPTSSKITTGPAAKKEQVPVDTLRQLDLARAGEDALAQAQERADAETRRIAEARQLEKLEDEPVVVLADGGLKPTTLMEITEEGDDSPEVAKAKQRAEADERAKRAEEFRRQLQNEAAPEPALAVDAAPAKRKRRA